MFYGPAGEQGGAGVARCCPFVCSRGAGGKARGHLTGGAASTRTVRAWGLQEIPPFPTTSQGIHPASSSKDGSWKDDAISAALRNHNLAA